MTKVQKDEAIAAGELSPDFLDRFWPLFWAFFILTFCVVLTTAALVVIHLYRKMLPWPMVFALLYFLTALVVSVYLRQNERRLKCVATNLSQVLNEEVVRDAARALGWKIKKEENCSIIQKPFAFGYDCYILKVLADDGCIYYNLRAMGSCNVRTLHTFGFETFRELQFSKKLRQFAEDQHTVR